MKKTFFALATVSAIAFAAPAAAQYESANADMRTRVDQLQGRLQAGVQAGTITRAEARTLREQLRQLRALETQYSANGLTQSERQDLQGRMQALRRDLRTAEASNNGQRYGQSDWMDRDRDGYDDRDRDRDGRWDDDQGNYGQGGPYEEVDEACQTRSGVGGVIDTVLGRECLRVGARAPSNLGAVPYAYRSQFRDGSGYYYRSDGDRVYQIDSRTRTVMRVYDID
jgi:TolA-binding protein